MTDEEKLTPLRGFGVGMGFVGVVVLVWPDVMHGGVTGGLLGELACVLAAVTYAFAGVYGRRFSGVPAITAATGQLVAASLLMLPLVLVVDRPWTLPAPPMSTWAALLGTAVLSTAAGYPVYFRLLALAGATNLLLVTFLLPISALLLGVLFLHEPITAAAVTGMSVIGLGLAAIDGRLIPRLALRSG